MEARLSLHSETCSSEDLQEMAIELSRALVSEPGIQVLEESVSSRKGAKGDPITIGTILLSLITSGAAVAMVNVVKSLIDRDHTLKIKIKTEKEEIEVDSNSLKAGQVDRILKVLERASR
jgi:hypothetical protein